MADLQEELKRRESRWSAASTRSRQKIEVLEEQNKELQEEVKLLEHYRLQQWREEEQAKVRYTPVKQCGDTLAVCDLTRVLVSLTELNNVCACAGLWRGKRTSRWYFPCRFSFKENFQKIFTSPGNRKRPSTTTRCLGFKCQPLFSLKFRWFFNLVHLSPRYWPLTCYVAFRYSALLVSPTKQKLTFILRTWNLFTGERRGGVKTEKTFAAQNC